MTGWISVPGEDASIALALVNSLHSGPNGDVDHLLTSAEVAVWLRSRGQQPAVKERDVALLAQLRAAVQQVFLAAVGNREPDPGAVDIVNEAATATPGAPSLSWSADGPSLVWTTIRPGTFAEVLAAIAGDAIDVVCGHRASTVRQCEAHGCVRIFFREHARRRWCSTTCGDRVRAARHYRAQQAPDA